MKSLLKVLLVFLLMLAFAPAKANALTFYLDEVNEYNTGTIGPWASVTLTDSIFNGKDAIHFVIDPIEAAFISLGPNFGIQAFYFNENTSFGNLLKIGNFNSPGWTVSYTDLTYNAGGGFGKFDFLTEGDGDSRVNPLSFDVYTDDNKELTIANFSTALSTDGYLFAAHIADYNGGQSAKFATDGGSTPVPEPGTMVLLGAGLMGLAVYGKRRISRS